MRKFILILILMVLVSGCSCQHEWTPAICEQLEICSLCLETQGEALGHDWIEATCDTPEVCARCAATQGESLGHTWADATCTVPSTCTRCTATVGPPLGHQYDSAWSLGDTTMSRPCTICSETETVDIDWPTYLDSTLQGRWVEESVKVFETLVSSQSVYGDYHNWGRPCVMEFSEGNRVQLLHFGGYNEILECSYTLNQAELGSSPDDKTYFLTIISDEGQSISLTVYLYFSNYNDLDLSNYDLNWYLQFPLDYDNDFSYDDNSDEPLIENTSSDLRKANRLTMFVESEYGVITYVYAKTDRNAPVAQVFNLPLGTWKSDTGNGTATFSELGTFAISGFPALSGKWLVDSFSWSQDSGYSYCYHMQLDDTSDYTGGRFWVNFDDPYYEHLTYLEIQLYSKEGQSYYLPLDGSPANPETLNGMDFEKLQHLPVGTMKPDNEESRQDPMVTADMALEFREDGTYTLGFSEPICGTWELSWYRHSYAEDFFAEYALTLPEDSPYDYARFSITHNDNGSDSFCLYLVTKSDTRHWLYFVKNE